MTYIQFLLTKIRKNKFNIIPFLIMTVFILFMYWIDFNHNSYIMSNPEFSGENEIIRYENDIKEFENELTQYPVSSEQYQITLENLNVAKERKTLLQNKFDAYNNKQWDKYYESNINLDNMLIEKAINLSDEVIDATNKDILYAKHMLKYNLNYDDRVNPLQGISHMAFVMKNYLPFLLVITLVFILSKLFTSLYKSEMDIHTLLPVDDLNKLNSKLFAGVFTGVLIILFIAILSIIPGTIGNCFGSLSSPIESFTSKGFDNYITFSSIFLQLIIFLLLSVVLITNIVYVVSIFTKKNMLCLAVSAGIILGCMWATTNVIPFRQIIHLFPTTYLDSIKVLSGQLTFVTGNTNINFTFGTIVLVVWNALLYVSCMYLPKYLKVKGK